MLVVHLLSSLREVSGRGAPESAYLTTAAYELVKLAVFFGFACYIAIKFLERASRSLARTSDLRSAAGYLLVAVLLFVLAVGVIGPLGGLAWSFLAGSLLARTEIGQPVVRSYRPAASAVFLSLAFLPMFVAPHGRSITRLPLLLSVIASLLVIKFTASWVAARVGGLSGRDSRAMAACSLAPGEIAVALLAFASTRWEIRAPEYFAVLLFSVAAMIAAPMLRHFEARGETRREERAPGRRVKFAVVIAAATALSVQGSVCAQSPEQKKPDDPVSRAMKSIEASIGERAEAAEAVLAASKLVNQSQSARKQGDNKLARKVLGDAEAITQASEEFSRSALIDELLRLVAEERAALDPPTRHGTDQVSPETSLAVAAPSSTRARFEQYRDSFARILEEERVPVGLLGVAFVESGFNPMALSPKGARGIWQLMPATAVRYGLMVQPGTDHRTHLERSTRAAARYLRDLYTQFGDWKLALAAYNAGEDRIQRIIDRTGIRDFDAMARRGYLPAETRRYVPAVLAAWARLATTKPLAAANARPRAQPRGGAVEALAKPEGSEPKR
jgi:soluble lytic murein transglycosylase-like protein